MRFSDAVWTHLTGMTTVPRLLHSPVSLPDLVGRGAKLEEDLLSLKETRILTFNKLRAKPSF